MPTTEKAGRAVILVIAGLLLAAAAAAPATAVMYSEGSPAFTAAIVGTNEFSPGDEATVRILLQNTGVNLFRQDTRGTITQEDLPNTAKSVTATLSSGTPLLSVRSDPLFVGTVPGGTSVPLAFTVKISSDATAREYQLPLTIQYLSPVVQDQPASDTYHFVYTDETATIPLTVRIKPGIKTEVVDVAAEDLTVGGEGTIVLTLQNTGQEDGTDAIVTLTRNGQSPVIPVDSSVFAGDFSAGNGTIRCRYKVAVSADAEGQVYPVDVSVSYKNEEGSRVTESPVTIGVPVQGKPVFSVVSEVPQLAAGSTAQISIRYRNDGAITVYDAQARITAHDPLAIDDDIAYLGDIAPGGTADAVFTIEAGSSAGTGTYSFDSRIRCRDAQKNSIESDTVPVEIAILPAQGGPLSGSTALIAGIVVAIGAAAAILAYWYRKKRQ